MSGSAVITGEDACSERAVGRRAPVGDHRQREVPVGDEADRAPPSSTSTTEPTPRSRISPATAHGVAGSRGHHRLRHDLAHQHGASLQSRRPWPTAAPDTARRVRRRIESLIRLAAPALDVVLYAGDRASRVDRPQRDRRPSRVRRPGLPEPQPPLDCPGTWPRRPPTARSNSPGKRAIARARASRRSIGARRPVRLLRARADHLRDVPTPAGWRRSPASGGPGTSASCRRWRSRTGSTSHDQTTLLLIWASARLIGFIGLAWAARLPRRRHPRPPARRSGAG